MEVFVISLFPSTRSTKLREPPLVSLLFWSRGGLVHGTLIKPLPCQVQLPNFSLASYNNRTSPLSGTITEPFTCQVQSPNLSLVGYNHQTSRFSGKITKHLYGQVYSPNLFLVRYTHQTSPLAGTMTQFVIDPIPLSCIFLGQDFVEIVF